MKGERMVEKNGVSVLYMCVSSIVLILCCKKQTRSVELARLNYRNYFRHLSSGGSFNILVEAMLNALSLFTFLRFPPHLRRMLCTTNWIERLNRSYKRTLRMRAAMPSPESVLFLLGSVELQMTTEIYSHRLYHFDDWYIK